MKIKQLALINNLTQKKDNILHYIMGHKKLIRFNAIKTFANVLENDTSLKGKWENHFGNQHPITLELACGKGEYTVGLSQIYPHRNHIGVDIKGNRIYIGAKKCLDNNITNAAYLRTAIDGISNFFGVNEINEIWITFPDPQLRWGKLNKRLTHPKYLRAYHQFLQKGGLVHLKTDSPDLYNFTKTVIALHGLQTITDYNDVYAQSHLSDSSNNFAKALKIKTHYEGLNISGSNKIYYLCFSLDALTTDNKDAELKAMLKPTELP